MAVLFYIEGQPVTALRAKDYVNEAMERPTNFSMYTMDTVYLYWNTKAKSEEAREQLFNITATLPQGGLEIIIESN